jgi:Protein of unknown function (DUF3618)
MSANRDDDQATTGAHAAGAATGDDGTRERDHAAEEKVQAENAAQQQAEEQAQAQEAAREEADQDTRSPEEIRADIEATRAELGDTVEALAGKTDVKARGQAKVEEVKENVRAKKDEVTSKIGGGGESGAFGGGTATGGQPGGGDSAQAKAQAQAQQIVAKVRENPAPVAIGIALLAGFIAGKLASR